MNEKALQELYDQISSEYEVGSFDEFKTYLMDDSNREAFFNEVISPNYEVASLDEFDNVYGLKKKEDFISNDPSSESELDKGFSGIPIFKFISDAVGRGVAQGNTTDEALSLLMSGSSATEDEVNAYIKAVQEMDSYAPSEGMNKFQKEYIEGGSDVSSFLSALWNNKSVAPEILLQSFAGMATAATTDEGAMAATAGLATGAAAGSFIPGVGNVIGGVTGAMSAANGALETATSMTDFIKEKLDEEGKDFNAENVRSILNDQEAFLDIRLKALKRGGIISAIDLIGGGVAGRAVKGVSEVSKLGARATKLAQVGAGLGIEGGFGSLGEAAAMAATGQEMDVAEIGLEGIAGFTTAPLSIGGAMRQSTYRLKNGNESIELSRDEFQKKVEENPSILTEYEVEIKNAPEGEKEKYDAIKKREQIKKDLPENLPEENIEAIADLEAEADKLKNKESISAKQRIKEIKDELARLSKKEEEVTEEAVEVAEVAEPTTEEPATEFTTKRVRVTEPFTIGQAEVTFNEDGTIKDIVNKKTRKQVSPSTRSKIEKKILQDVMDVDAGKKAPEVDGLRPDEVSRYIIENSENVREVAQAINDEKASMREAGAQGRIELEGGDLSKLIGLKFTSESWRKMTGEDPKKSKIDKVWIDDTKDPNTGKPNGLSIEDGWADALSREGELPVDTTSRIDFNDVISFIKKYNNKTKIARFEQVTPEAKTMDLVSLEQKFEKLTGAKATPTNVRTVLDIEEGRTPVELLKMQEQEQLRMQAEEPGVFGKKRGPSAKKIVGETAREPQTVTVDTYEALVDQLKLEAKAAREKKYSMDDARSNLSSKILDLVKAGRMTAKAASMLVKKVSVVNLDNPVMVERALAYAKKVFDNAENVEKISTANKIKNNIKKVKKGSIEATVKGAVKDFLKIDINLVENIDEYLEIADNVYKGLLSTRKTKDGIKLSDDVNLKKLSEFLDKELRKQTAIKEQAFLDKYYEILGDKALGMSYQEMKDAVNALNEEESKGETSAKQKEAIKQAFDDISESIKETMEFGRGAPEVQDVFDVTDREKSLIKRFTEMNLDLLNTKEAILALDALKNFLVNGTTGGMTKILSEFEGRSSVRRLLGDNFLGYDVGSIGRFWGKQLAALNILSEYIFRGQEKALQFFQESGVQGIINGNSKATKLHEVLQNDYESTFSKRKANNEDFSSSYNITERGLIAFAIRNLQGTVQEQVNEFNRRKSLIKQSIESMKRQGGQLAKKAEFYEQAYNKILESSAQADEVLSKADKTNVEAVEWWVDKWSEIYPSLYDVSLNVYNKLLSKDVRYTPDFYAREQSRIVEGDLLTPGFQEDPVNVLYDKESRTLKETKRPNTLNEKQVSYVDLNFDRANLNAYKNALVDVETAESISRVNGFLNDPAFQLMISNDQTREVLKSRIYAYVRNIKGGGIPSSKDSKDLAKFLDKIATFSVGRALAGPTQFVKQLIPVVNTLMNAGDLSVHAYFKPGAIEFILKSGYGIASRGFASLSDVTNLNESIKSINRFDNKTLDFLGSLNKKLLKAFVQTPDRYAAQVSWLTYYIKDLKKQGFSQEAIDNIDWETHKINTQAGDYAQQQVDRQQNVSDVGLQGEFFSSRNIGISLARKIIAPFMNFALNQKSRMYSDVVQLSSKHSSVEDKRRSAASLVGLAAETAAFNTLGYGISMGLYAATKGIIGGEEETDEERQKRVDNIIKGRLGNIASDIASPFPKVTDPLIIDFTNMVLRAVQSGDEKDIFQFFPRDKDSFYDQLGVYGIAPKYAGELYELSTIALTGKYIDNYGRTVELDPKAQELAYTTFLPKLLYASGIAPVEVGTMSNYAIKELKKLKKAKSKVSGSPYQRTYRYK